MRKHVRNARKVRIGAAAVVAAAALVLTGCSSDSDDGDKGKDSSASDSGSSAGSSGESSAPGDGGDSGSQGGSLDGSWVTTADGKPLALAVTGKTASLVGENVLCTGTVSGGSGSQMLMLKCAKGNDDRSMGKVTSVDDKTLKVDWDAVGTDTFTKTEGGKLPSGLPTADLPTS
ncbi:hypothetical protein [Streptomyces sp. NPDC059009]|uniref:hypothetical protein n=1 Tax=Streptomyces sp. NPDC059009 TaxID=3346694 RepID=UPI0036AD01EC